MHSDMQTGDDATEGTMTAALGGLVRLLDGAPTLAAARGIPEAGLDGIYAVGHELYGTGRYAEAGRSFALLCLYDHRNARNWHALGLCRQALEDYAGAAEALAFAAGQADAADHAVQLSLAECLLAAGFADAAATALEPLVQADSEVAEDRNVRFLAAQIRAARTDGGREPAQGAGRDG